MENNNSNQKPQKKNRCGINNPMWGKKHSQQSREKMSQAAILRNQEYQKWKDSQHHVTMDEFLSANPSVKEYIKVLANNIIKEEIEKLVWRKLNQQISIPKGED